jgi:Rrf2 family protein
MKLSTRTRYGIRAIIELAGNHGCGPLQLKEIARRQEISIKYLEQLMAVLKSAGYVRSIRGAKGGYLLAKPPGKIKLSEVFTCLEGPVTTVECVADENYCARIADCVARGVWMEIEKAIEKVLEAVTLKDLVERMKNRKALYYQI